MLAFNTINSLFLMRFVFGEMTKYESLPELLDLDETSITFMTIRNMNCAQ